MTAHDIHVTGRSVYRGPHLYGSTPMVRVGVDLGEFATVRSTDIPDFIEALHRALPGIGTHRCSTGRPGGFDSRLADGTLLGHVAEHVALELQASSGAAVSRGKTRAVRGRAGEFDLLVAYEDATVGRAAVRLALEFVAGLAGATVDGLDLVAPPLDASPGDAVPGMTAFRRLAASRALGPSTRALVAEARRRRIPVERLDGEGRIRLGWGSRQQGFSAGITSRTSHLGVLIAADKQRTKAVLDAVGIPVPRGRQVTTADEAVAALDALRPPVVVKPRDGNHGRGVTTDLDDADAVRSAFAEAAAISPRVLVEEQVAGTDHRLLVVDGRVVAVAERRPPSVTGDGTRTVAELLEALNADPRREDGHAGMLTRIVVDDPLHARLAQEQLTLDDVPSPGRTVRLRDTANLSTGGEAIDRTDDVHPAVAALAERAARAVGLDVAGIDLLATDIARSPAETGCGIIEVNAAPGLRMHVAPSSGVSRNVARPIIEAIYPRGSSARIPVVAVTGTNGKSTTVRMIAHILGSTGLNVGLTTTSGVSIGGQPVRSGDSSGPRSARLILADPTVDAAVLETARGGILREGLAYDGADVGVVLNVSADHLGIGGIDTVGRLARVKSVVARNVRRRGTTVLNADDPWTRRMARVAGGRVAWFTMGGDELDDDPREHVAEGGVLVAFERSTHALVVHSGEGRRIVGDAMEIPATHGGAASFNVANALAAVAAAHALGVALDQIAAALATFTTSFDDNPGRFNVTDAPGFTTVVDYAHNPAALRELGVALRSLQPTGRLIGVISTPGDRRDADIEEMGAIAVEIFDEVVFREPDDPRGREPGAISQLLARGAWAAGADEARIHLVAGELTALDAGLRLAGPDDLVAMTPTDVDAVWAAVHAFRSPVAVS